MHTTKELRSEDMKEGMSRKYKEAAIGTPVPPPCLPAEYPLSPPLPLTCRGDMMCSNRILSIMEQQ